MNWGFISEGFSVVDTSGVISGVCTSTGGVVISGDDKFLCVWGRGYEGVG